MKDFGKAKRKWFSTVLRPPNGIPGHDTFNGLFARLDPVSLRSFRKEAGCAGRTNAAQRKAK